jgi:xylulokinase
MTEAEQRGTDVYELINAAAENSAPGANGVLFLPYMLGERSPHWNPNARGVFAGMNLATSHGDLCRAVMEGITMNLATIVAAFRQSVPIDTVRVIGGCARSALWRQMMADMYGCRIEKLKHLEEATSMGAAMIAGVGAGVFKDFEVVEQFIAVDEVATPDAATRAKYLKVIPVFEKCYRALVEVYDDLAALQNGAAAKQKEKPACAQSQ